MPEGALVYIPEGGYDEQIIPELSAEEEIAWFLLGGANVIEG